MLLVTGANGQLGSAVAGRAKECGLDVVGVDIDDFNITKADEVNRYFKQHRPASVIHCAAYTNVNKAEDDYDACFEANCTGTLNIAAAAGEYGSKLLYISTDYVFDGESDVPYETDAQPNPLSVYGKSKLAGEAAVTQLCKKSFVVRTSWVFGSGGNFIRTMLKLADTQPMIKVVADQVGSPTYTEDLAILLCNMIQTEKYGVYHASNDGFCSWFELACEVMLLANKSVPVLPVLTEDYESKAKRPKNSRLSKLSLDRAGFDRLPPWQNAVGRYVAWLQQEKGEG